MHPASGLNFHPEIAHPTVPSHLVLAVRRHHVAGYTVRGVRELEVGQHYASANEAVKAVRRFCRMAHCTARVSVYAPDATLWTMVEIL